MPDKKTVAKSGVNKLFIIAILSLFPMNFADLHIAFSCMTLLEYNFDICWLKLSWLSISISSNFTDLIVSISLLYIFNLCVIAFFLLLFIIAWNLSGLAIMLLVLNQSSADSDSFSSVRRRLFRFLQATAMVLSSAKLCKSDFVYHTITRFASVLSAYIVS